MLLITYAIETSQHRHRYNYMQLQLGNPRSYTVPDENLPRCFRDKDGFVYFAQQRFSTRKRSNFPHKKSCGPPFAVTTCAYVLLSQCLSRNLYRPHRDTHPVGERKSNRKWDRNRQWAGPRRSIAEGTQSDTAAAAAAGALGTLIDYPLSKKKNANSRPGTQRLFAILVQPRKWCNFSCLCFVGSVTWKHKIKGFFHGS